MKQNETDRVEKLPSVENLKAEMKEKQADIVRVYSAVFNTRNGKKVLENLENQSNYQFPNYENVNATYAKIGEQNLVKHIKQVLKSAKKLGGK